MKLGERAGRQLLSPESEAELVSAVREARAHGRRILPIGCGSELAWCGVPEAADLLISTEHLAGLVAHVPADGTVSARAGTRLSDLRAAVRAGGHFLTPDVPNPGVHTLGGILAAGQSGPDRLRFGPARHHVLGMRVLLADGTTAKSGGQLVKNVTGYDLHRLYCGSHGSLCVILEAALRLFPEPEDELCWTVEVRGTAELLAWAQAVRASRVRPLALVAERGAPGDRWRAHLRLAGMPVVLERERAWLERGLGPAVELVAESRGPAARAAAEAVRDRLWTHREEPFVRISGPPDCLPAVLAELERCLGGAVPLWLEPGIAAVEAALPQSAVSELGGLAQRLEARAGVTVQAFDGHSGPWPALSAASPASTGLEIMRALKRRLDPEGLFAREV